MPVLTKLGPTVFRATLVPVGGGRHRLYLNGLMRRPAGREIGDMVRVILTRDAASRVLPIPADLATALHAAGRMTQFLAGTPSRRKEIIRWILANANASTRRRRIDLAAAHFDKRRKPAAQRRRN